MNNFKDSDPRCAAAIADQQTKPIFNNPFKPKQWPRRDSRQFGKCPVSGLSGFWKLSRPSDLTWCLVEPYNEDFVNNFEDSDPSCAAAIADQQTKPIFDAPFKPKQWPRRGSRQFGDIFLHTKVGMSAIYSLTTKPQATDFFRQFVYLLTEQKPGTKTFWFYKGILLIFFWRT